MCWKKVTGKWVLKTLTKTRTQWEDDPINGPQQGILTESCYFMTASFFLVHFFHGDMYQCLKRRGLKTLVPLRPNPLTKVEQINEEVRQRRQEGRDQYERTGLSLHCLCVCFPFTSFFLFYIYNFVLILSCVADRLLTVIMIIIIITVYYHCCCSC